MPFNKQIKRVLVVSDNDYSISNIVSTFKSENVEVIVMGNCASILQVCGLSVSANTTDSTNTKENADIEINASFSLNNTSVADSVYICQPTTDTINRVVAHHVPDSIFWDVLDEDLINSTHQDSNFASFNIKVLYSAKVTKFAPPVQGYQKYMLLYLKDSSGETLFLNCTYDGDILVTPCVILTTSQLSTLQKVATDTIKNFEKPGLYKVRVCSNTHDATTQSNADQDLQCHVVSVCSKLNDYSAFASNAMQWDIAEYLVKISMGYTLNEILTVLPTMSQIVYGISTRTKSDVIINLETNESSQVVTSGDLYQDLIRKLDATQVRQFVFFNGLYLDSAQDLVMSNNVVLQSVTENINEFKYEIFGVDKSILDTKNTKPKSTKNESAKNTTSTSKSNKSTSIKKVDFDQILKNKLPYKLVVRTMVDDEYIVGKRQFLALACEWDEATNVLNSLFGNDTDVDLQHGVTPSVDTENIDISTNLYNSSMLRLYDFTNLPISPMELKFIKMHGAGNDYIFIDCLYRNLNAINLNYIIWHMSRRHFGIGSDGVVLITKSSNADGKMIMYNADASRGSMCGNAIRCVAKYLYEKGVTNEQNIKIETDSGIKNITVTVKDNKVTHARVDMGKANLVEPRQITLDGIVKATDNITNETNSTSGGANIIIKDIVFVDVGNPHCVVFLNKDEFENLDINTLGTLYQDCKDFGDISPNVEFVYINSENTATMRVYERGSGETLACGTGACASIVAGIHKGIFNKNTDISVHCKGGILKINVTDDTIYMTGDCHSVYSGVVEIW